MESISINPSIETDELSRYFGSGGRRGFSSSLRTKVDNYYKKIGNLLEPRLFYKIEKITRIDNKSITISGNTVFRSRNLSLALKNSYRLVCFIATVGSAIENEVNRLFAHKRLSEAYILDTMGSVAVESTVERFHQSKKAPFISKDKAVTLRFSPGYCDWPITEQKKLFNLFGSELRGIKLLDSCLMQPRKSISGVFGLVHCSNPTSFQPYNPCRYCRKTDCVARRI
jgi:hypothetical protein